MPSILSLIIIINQAMSPITTSTISLNPTQSIERTAESLRIQYPFITVGTFRIERTKMHRPALRRAINLSETCWRFHIKPLLQLPRHPPIRGPQSAEKSRERWNLSTGNISKKSNKRFKGSKP
ncbi:hypothetical protein B0H66DRAFT_568645 [Apodospora peruviana]|uniref:Uncharacterized protein n=1 Tax=Apodospora peruviana TaxID=516989 RepID=A0AAE0LZK3_9PEZI|nr:hypothetical protein B0H66DRAFT_568645 [Apodospora peruviana]